MKHIRSLSTALALVVVLAAGFVLGRMSAPNHRASTLAQLSIVQNDLGQLENATLVPVAIEGADRTAYDLSYTMPDENNSEGKTFSFFMSFSR